jgi:hypothetical protein
MSRAGSARHRVGGLFRSQDDRLNWINGTGISGDTKITM